MNTENIKLTDVANKSIIGDEISSLKAFGKALSDKGLKLPSGIDLSGVSYDENMEKAAEMYVEAQNPVIISAPSLFEAAQNIAMVKGLAVSIPFEANSKGTILMGINGKGKSYKDIVGGDVNVLYAIGSLPVKNRPDVDFLIVQSAHMTDLAKEADIVLPAAAYLEMDGTIVDYMGRIKNLVKIVEPPEEAKSDDTIIKELAKKMKLDLKAPKKSDITKASNIKVKASIKPFEKRTELDIKFADILETMNEPIINGSRLLWLKEVEEGVPA